MSTAPFRYHPALDGLRAVAVLLVVASHCRVPGFYGGFFGVDLFFVLSGFLITRLLVDECDSNGRIDLPLFYLRRCLRLTPPLLAMLAAYLLIAPMLWPRLSLGWHLRDAALAAFYVSDYARAFWNAPHVLQHSWSLSVEEHFYLVWPLAVLALLRLPERWRPAALFGLYVAATAWRIACYATEASWPEVYYRFDTRMSGLILGALIATALDRVDRVPERLANISGVLATGTLALSLMLGRWGTPDALAWPMTLAEFATGAALIAMAAPESWLTRSLSAPPLVAAGVLSYGLYLWHYPVAVFFRGLLPWYETAPLVLAIAFLAATISHLLIERPLQGLRRSLRAPPRRQPGGSGADVRLAARAAATFRR